MNIDLNTGRLYAYTGGKAWTPGQPVVVLIHGVLNDHSVWVLQSRHLAHHGFNVLAIDLPGHGRSEGRCPPSVASASATVLAALEVLGVEKAALVGHSWGSLIALHTAAQHPSRVTHLGLLGSASPMRVSPTLLQQSVEAPMDAIDLVTAFSHSTWAPGPSALGPGTWVPGAARALMRHLHAHSADPALFHTGFAACDAYDHATADMAHVRCPTLFLVGQHDHMTPPKAALPLLKAAQAAGTPCLHRQVNAGHSLMTEAPGQTLAAINDLLAMQPV